MIIDGVDVSECKYFDCDSKECKAEYYIRYGYEIEKYDSCRENPNCYFKQLKRAEQKLEKTKDIATDLLSLTNEYDNCYYKDKCNKCDKECQYKFVDKILQIIEGKENG